MLYRKILYSYLSKSKAKKTCSLAELIDNYNIPAPSPKVTVEVLQEHDPLVPMNDGALQYYLEACELQQLINCRISKQIYYSTQIITDEKGVLGTW